MQNHALRQRLGAELLGTAFLLATVIGSGIMGERLSGGNVALALLGNTIPTGAILFVLITMFGPISGAHFNPAVTAVFAIRKNLPPSDAVNYVIVQVLGAVVGVLVAHLMFERKLCCKSPRRLALAPHSGFPSGSRPLVSFLTILLTLKANRGGGSSLGQPLHHRSLLVHCLDIVRQPGCDCPLGPSQTRSQVSVRTTSQASLLLKLLEPSPPP